MELSLIHRVRAQSVRQHDHSRVSKGKTHDQSSRRSQAVDPRVRLFPDRLRRSVGSYRYLRAVPDLAVVQFLSQSALLSLRGSLPSLQRPERTAIWLLRVSPKRLVGWGLRGPRYRLPWFSNGYVLRRRAQLLDEHYCGIMSGFRRLDLQVGVLRVAYRGNLAPSTFLRVRPRLGYDTPWPWTNRASARDDYGGSSAGLYTAPCRSSRTHCSFTWMSGVSN